jgi:hypothetical protein
MGPLFRHSFLFFNIVDIGGNGFLSYRPGKDEVFIYADCPDDDATSDGVTTPFASSVL